MYFLILASIILLIEVTLWILIHTLKQRFQWLITSQDNKPQWTSNDIEKFFNKSHHPDLGWVKRPNTRGREKAKGIYTHYTIGSAGQRINPSNEFDSSQIAVFGDSYAFCRQVENNQTWPEQLAIYENTHVQNYGAGNYGVDQALLRYEKTILPTSTRIAVMCFVPETICRVHSYWKHYLEFGNTFAFKPRFVVDNGNLKLLPNLIRSRKDLHNLKSIIQKAQEQDDFYTTKFKKYQFNFPYTLSFLKNWKRNWSLIQQIFRYQISGQPKDNPFQIIMRDNIEWAHHYYQNPSKKALLEKILLRFKNSAKRCGHTPLIVVAPQLIDLKMPESSRQAYTQFYQHLNKFMHVIDLTPSLLKEPNISQLYVEDEYGGHFSAHGNQVVASIIHEYIQDYLRPLKSSKHNEQTTYSILT